MFFNRAKKLQQIANEINNVFPIQCYVYEKREICSEDMSVLTYTRSNKFLHKYTSDQFSQVMCDVFMSIIRKKCNSSAVSYDSGIYTLIIDDYKYTIRETNMLEDFNTLTVNHMSNRLNRELVYSLEFIYPYEWILDEIPNIGWKLKLTVPKEGTYSYVIDYGMATELLDKDDYIYATRHIFEQVCEAYRPETRVPYYNEMTNNINALRDFLDITNKISQVEKVACREIQSKRRILAREKVRTRRMMR